jgi:diguanylate cyclase (GGDEF)-like protein
MSGSRRWSPDVATLVLAGALLTAGLTLCFAGPAAGLLAAPSAWPAPAVVIGLAAVFLLAELCLIHVEFRSQAWSFSLSGIPLVLGTLWVGPRDLILARVIGTAVAFALQRPAAVKAAYNMGAYVLEAAAISFLAHEVLGNRITLDVATASIGFLVVAASDVLMSILVLFVIRLNRGSVSPQDVVGVIAPAAAFGTASTAVAFIAALLVESGLLGCILLAAAAGGGGVAYHGYLKLRRRHKALSLVQEFIAESGHAGSVEELAGRLLSRARLMLRATRAELILASSDGDMRLAVGDDDVPYVKRHSDDSSDWLFSQVRAHAEPVLVPRNTRDRSKRRWLADHGFRDALLVPMTEPDAGAMLILVDRLGDATTFTTDDLKLGQTLAGHLSVSLHGSRLVQQLRHDAHHDVLTGLPNRALLSKRLVAALAGLDAGASLSVLLLDLDRFKEVNDTLGHHVGDALLKVVGQRLCAAAPADSVVARLGGDEFAIMLPATLQGDMEARARAIGAALAAPVHLGEALVSTQASIGAALSRAGLTASDLLRHADTAMYSAKASGQQVVVYTPELDRGRAESLSLLADLHLALDRDEFELLYQPKLDLVSGEITGVEALVRWRHPRLGLLEPSAFIALAESTGLMDKLTHVVLNDALRQCRRWRDAGLDLTVAVNLSARNIDNLTLPEEVAKALAHAGLPADRLILEITESSVMGDLDRTVPTLNRLADIGVMLSLDDFGTGYSSLAYLQRLPVGELKIDRSFVTGLGNPGSGPASEALIRTILLLAKSLSLRVVAEGIETSPSLDRLRELGCDIGQGYHIGYPVDADDIFRRLRPPSERRNPLTIVAG